MTPAENWRHWLARLEGSQKHITVEHSTTITSASSAVGYLEARLTALTDESPVTPTNEKTREAVEEARDCVRACSNLADGRWLEVVAMSAPEDTGISLGTLRVLLALVVATEP